MAALTSTSAPLWHAPRAAGLARAARLAVGIALLSVVPWMGAVIGVGLLWEQAWLRVQRLRPVAALGAFCARAARRAAPHLLRDPRDAPYLYTLFGVGLWTPGLFAISAWWQARAPGFDWAAAFAYGVLTMGPYFVFFAYVSTLAHKEGHAPRGLWKPRFRWLNGAFGGFLGFFYGHVPRTWPLGHLHIHHRHGNDLEDAHTTLDLDRTRPSQFVHYLPRFAAYWTGLSVAAWFFARGKRSEGWRTLRGAGLYYGLVAGVALLDATFAFAYLLLPHLSTLLYLAAVNYVWHAFHDPAVPDDEYVNSTTILNGQYNVLNEDYHVAHHLHPQLHWTEMPRHYTDNLDVYRERRATLFRDTHEFELFFWILFRRFDLLSEHFVDLSGTLSAEEKVALLRARMAPAPRPSASA
jgi:fatty acid desaturase